MSASLADRVAAKRREVEARRQARFILPVPDYQELLAVKYRKLLWEERMDIIERDGGTDTAERVTAAADMLIAACEDLLEVDGTNGNGEPVYKPLGKRWSTPAIIEYFGIGLPENATVRHALREALGSDALMTHFAEYVREVGMIETEGEGAATGEASPSEEG